MGKVRCGCPDPPGGSVTCDEADLAICRVTDGKVEASCHKRPEDLADEEVGNWALRHLTGDKGRSLSQPLLPSEDRILREGKFRRGDEQFAFRLKGVTDDDDDWTYDADD